jgi:hypothetical protein
MHTELQTKGSNRVPASNCLQAFRFQWFRKRDLRGSQPAEFGVLLGTELGLLVRFSGIRSTVSAKNTSEIESCVGIP